MKKMVWMLVVIILFVSLFIPIVLVAGEDNLDKAGQAALAERETTLIRMKDEIESFIWRAVEDRIVSKDEMVNLKKLFNDFVETKSRFDSELKIYGLMTSTGLDEEYEKAIDAYFGGNTLFKEDNRNEDARIFFVTKTGVDVTIKRGAVVHGTVIFLIVLAGLALLVTIALAAADSPMAIGFGALFAVFLLALLLL